MAIEYVLETIGGGLLEATLGSLARHVSAVVVGEGFAERDGLHVMAAIVPADEIETTELLLGHHDIVSTTFRLLNNTDPAVEAGNLAATLAGVVRFLDEAPETRGVFTHEGERILLQRITTEPVVFDLDWRQYTLDVPRADLDAIEAGHQTVRLPQPVLSIADYEALRALGENR